MIFTTKDGRVATALNWVAPTKRTDGSAYGAADHAGYELGVADAAAPGGFRSHVSVPAVFGVTTWPLDQLNITLLGDVNVALRAVDKGGRTSAWSSPLVFVALLASPNAPTGLNAS